jgi:methylated-DNA-[protein]-cysteine S-methyltransferase
MDSPIGLLTLIGTNEALTSVRFGQIGYSFNPSPLLLRTVSELREYFDGRRKSFDIPLAPEGTDFQKRVWQALCDIPYGETRSYGDIAKALDSPRAARAIGLANNKNPIPIIIPCHRVIGADGSMVGYAGGLETKEFLLKLEKEHKKRK